MENDRYDVAVVGAGPGGSTCARHCAGQGLRTLLLDRAVFPRDKVCGGAVSERALQLLDFPLPSGIVERECCSVRVFYRRHCIDSGSDRRRAVFVSREKFDQCLMEKAVEAGAEFRQGERVVALSTRKDRVLITTDRSAYEARCVAGADGANSVVARTVRPHFSRSGIAAALAGRIPASNRVIDQRTGGRLEMHYGVAPLGYGWVFPHDGSYSVGIMGEAARLDDPRRLFADFVRSAGFDEARPRGHTIPRGGIRREIIGSHTLLLGDAAGFADPFTGEGIVHAIHSGILAAAAFTARIRRQDRDAFTRYERTCEQRIRKNLAVALHMARLLERYPSLFLAVFFSDAQALDRYLDIASGTIDYLQFRRWLLPRLPRYLFRMIKGKQQG